MKGNRAAGLRWLTRCVEAAKLPSAEQRIRLRELEAETANLPILVRLLAPAVAKVGEACFRSQAELECGIAALAAERYRQAHGRWPDSLDDLLPKYLPRVPIDPFSGQPIRLVRTREGLVVYSVGYNGVDDRGGPHRRRPAKPLQLQRPGPVEPQEP
jgi:hypothetical protein